MQRNERYTSILWAILGLYIAYEGYVLKLGTLKDPKSGFLVFWTGMVLAGLSFILFLQSLFIAGPVNGKKGIWEGIEWRKGTKMMIALFAYALVFKSLGFLVSTFFLLLFLFKGIEPQKWKTALVLSSVTVVVCYMVFGLFLELQFPSGILSGLFGQ
jgi:putative tricarboxylic transport membrane protein